MRSKESIAAAAALVWALAPPAMAQIPVTDGANLAQSIQQALTTINQLQQQYQDFDQQIQQYEQQLEQYSASTGSYGLGELFGGDQAKTYAPGTWQGSLAILEQGGSPGNAADVADYARDYQDRYGFAAGNEVYSSGNSEQAAYTFDQQARSTRAALAISRTAYNRTGERLQRIQTYLDRIDSATDLKAAIDLQNRLNVEIAQALMEQNRLMAVQMQLGGAQGAQRTRETQTNATLFRFRADEQ